MNMRKIIAVLAAALMLCAIIPMGAISVSAADAVYSADFEDGSVSGWTSATCTLVAAADLPVANPDGGNYAMKFVSTSYHYANHAITVEKNTNYKVTYSVLNQSTSSSYGLIARVRTNGSVDLVNNTINPELTAWQTYTYYFNSGDNTSLNLRFQAAWSTATYYIDNITVEAVTDLAYDGYFYNGDFESGDNSNWISSANTAVVADPTGAGQGYVMQTSETANKTMFRQNAINLKTNTYYELSFKVYGYTTTGATNSAFWVQFNKNITTWSITQSLNGSAQYNAYTPRINVNSKLNAWYTVKIKFNTGDLTATLIDFINYRTNNGYYYFDDIALREVPDPSFDGYIYNGNFETGDSGNWDIYQQTAVDKDSAHSGTYGIHTLYPAGSWSGLVTQTISNLEVGKTYGVMFWYKAITGGVNVNVKDSAGTAICKLGWNNATEWTKKSGTFTATETTASLAFSSGGTGAQEEVYIDDILVYEVKDPSFDGYITNGDFECNSTTGWSNVYSPSTITYDAAQVHDGAFALALYTNGGWGGVGSQTVQNLVVGNQYYISLWVLSDGAYINGSLKDSAGTALASFPIRNNYTEWTQYDLTFTATETTATINFNGPGKTDYAGYGYVDSIKIEAVCDRDGHTAGAEADCGNAQTCTVCGVELAPATGEHTWVDADCDTAKTCSVCGASEGDALGHNYVGEETQAPACTETGVMTYTCSVCGDSYTEDIPAAHTYTDNCDFDCDVCGEYRDAPHNLTTYVEAVVPANCQEEGHNEYWICADCGGYFMSNGAGGYYETNPAWMYYTGDHVRPEDAIVCAVVACELCGEDTYGESCTRPEGAPECTDVECVNCGETIYGWGHNYNTGDEETPLPLCGEGDCVYCGEHFDKLYDHENGAWAPCLDGECSYGCGLAFPATENHVLEDCTVGGYCQVCWSEIPAGEHAYDHEFDADCNVCGAVRDVVAPIAENGFSISEDVSGLAIRFTATLEGMGINGTTAIYDNATLNGYKVVSMGAIVTNGVSTIDIPAVYLCDDDVSTSAQYAIRIKNIPTDKYNVEITFTPYMIIEIDGVATTVYGEAQVGSYAEVVG